MSKGKQFCLHSVILTYAFLTLLPFFFVINNSFRTNSEMFRSFFGPPEAVVQLPAALKSAAAGGDEQFLVHEEGKETEELPAKEAAKRYLEIATKGYRISWRLIRPYMVNSLVVCTTTAFGVLLFGSMTAYILSRYRFWGSKAIFYYIISTMMFPGALTLVPAFMLVKYLGLLNTYWAMVLPYVAGGQVFAIFVFKSFFDGLPEELFESARIDGAGHLQLYWHIVVPLSKPVLSVVAIMNILGTWNNFLWPFVTNTEGKFHVVASGLYVLATSAYASNYCTLFAAYMLSSIPLLLLFIYATRTFIQGVTSGAFKA